MARDVKIWKDEGGFKLRVCGIIKNKDKYLVSIEEFYSFPGGHVHIAENTDEAVVREIKEETNIDVKIDKLLAIVQLFSKFPNDGRPFHEICYYYLLSPKTDIELKDFKTEETDNDEIKIHKYKWYSLEELKNLNLRIEEIVNILRNNLERQHIIKYRESLI